jgi:hypothetical protein
MPMKQTHTPSPVSFHGLAVMQHCFIPPSPLAECGQESRGVNFARIVGFWKVQFLSDAFGDALNSFRDWEQSLAAYASDLNH